MEESLQLEHLTATYMDDYVTTAYVPECITEGSNEFTLQNMCRKGIRKCVLDIDLACQLLSDHIFCSIFILKLKKPVNLQTKLEPAHALTLNSHH